MMVVVVWIIGLGAIAGAVWRFRASDGTYLKRIIEALAVASIGGTLFMAIGRLMTMGAVMELNDARLAPVVGMTRGIALYQDPATGVMTGWTAGPVGAIVLLPAALAKTPTTASLIGGPITFFCYIAPAAWLLAMVGMRHNLRWLAGLAILALATWTLQSENLNRAATFADADGPALGLAACSCALIYHRRTLPALALSALAAILCIWTKQTFLTLLPALLIWVWIVDGAKTTAIYAALLAGIGLVISIVLIYSFGARNMYFHMVQLPWSHSLGDVGLFRAWLNGLVYLTFTCIYAIALILLVLVLDGYVREPASSFREWVISRQWPMLLMVSIFLVPSSLLGFMKSGGLNNNLAHAHYFLALGGLAGVIETCAHASSSLARPVRSIASLFLSLSIILITFENAFAGRSGITAVWHHITNPYENTREVLYRYISKNPGTVYCPWNPLISLLGEGKLYHFEGGLLDRSRGSNYLSFEHFAAHLPANRRMIAYARTPVSTATHRSFGASLKQTEVEELPGCVVYIP